MANFITIYSTSKDVEKIKVVKKWIQMTKIPHKDRLISPIFIPRNLRLSPNEISAYASAINTLLVNERVTDYTHNSFITVKKEAFPKVCFNNDFYAKEYRMELDELGWHIVPD